MSRRNRRTNAEMFLDELRELSGDEPSLIGNLTLRDALNWDQEKYDRVKYQMMDENEIILGRGRGGSVALAFVPESEALTVFISYCHADKELKEELLKHLEPLKRLNLIKTWSDRELIAGDEWGREISDKLESANIVILLISIDFINSEYCYDIELERALELHSKGSAVVAPVILRTCMWQHAPFAKLQVLPRDAKAVFTWPDRDEALTDVANGIRKIAERLRDRE